MKQILNIFAFTYSQGVRKKAFIITTVIILAVILILCTVPRLLIVFTDGNVDSLTEGTFYTCYFVDETGMFDAGIESLSVELTDTRFDKKYPDELDVLRSDIENNARHSLIHITNGEDGKPVISVVAKDFLNGVAGNYETVGAVLSQVYAEKVMQDAGIDQELIDVSKTELVCTVESEGNLTMSGYAIGIVLITLTFFAVYYYGYGVASSVASEKSSRVMETLVVSTEPWKILVGKCFGMGAVGLTQFGGAIIFAIICWIIFIPEGFTFMGQTLSLDAFTPKSAILILIFFMLGYMLYAFMNAVSGASVDKIEDLNTVMMPVMIISMGSFYLSYFTAIMGTTYDYLVNLSLYIPFSAPFIMPFELLNGEVSTGQILLSLGILAATLLIVAFVSIRIYTASVMHYGKRIKVKDALKNIKNTKK